MNSFFSIPFLTRVHGVPVEQSAHSHERHLNKDFSDLLGDKVDAMLPQVECISLRAIDQVVNLAKSKNFSDPIYQDPNFEIIALAAVKAGKFSALQFGTLMQERSLDPMAEILPLYMTRRRRIFVFRS